MVETYLDPELACLAKSRAEIAANPDTEASLRRLDAYLRRPVVYPSSMRDGVEEDAIMAFNEGDGDNACPFAWGVHRRHWLETYYGMDRET